MSRASCSSKARIVTARFRCVRAPPPPRLRLLLRILPLPLGTSARQTQCSAQTARHRPRWCPRHKRASPTRKAHHERLPARPDDVTIAPSPRASARSVRPSPFFFCQHLSRQPQRRPLPVRRRCESAAQPRRPSPRRGRPGGCPATWTWQTSSRAWTSRTPCSFSSRNR
jgi:hypothetical protein